MNRSSSKPAGSPTVAPAKGRRGVILVAVIVCTAVASMIFLSTVKTVAAGRRMMQEQSWRLQAAWLAESGLERAAARLAADPGYQGETWNVPAEQLAGSDAAVVNIEVQPAGEQPDLRLVSVRADYPDHPRHRARQTKRALVQLPTRKGANP